MYPLETQTLQSPSGKCSQTGHELGRPCQTGHCFKMRRGTGIADRESLDHLLPHFESLRSNARPQPDTGPGKVDLTGIRLQRFAQGLENSPAVLTGQPSPSGMGCRHTAPVCRRNENGQTIGHEHHGGCARRVGPSRISHWTGLRARFQSADRRAMDLHEERHVDTPHGTQTAAVLDHVIRGVAHMITQVEGIPGRKGVTSRAQGATRPDAWGPWGIGIHPSGVVRRGHAHPMLPGM